MDVGLTQAELSADWFLRPMQSFVNKRPLVEAFVGQELIAYQSPYKKATLFYWFRKARGSLAEIDYVIQTNGQIVPIEVKSGAGTTLKSLHSFLETHKESPYGIRFSSQTYPLWGKIYSYPLYGIATVAISDPEVKKSIESLLN